MSTGGYRLAVRHGCRPAAATVALVIAVSMLATGCGGASHHSSHTTTVLSAATSGVARKTTHRGSPSRPSDHTSAPRSRKHPAVRFSRATGKRRVLLAASSACAFSRLGAPAAPLQSAKLDSWRHYEAAARPFALRTAVALRDVPSGRFQLPELQRVFADYNHLAHVYATGGSAASLARMIASSEQQTAADALAARVPACAPLAPRGASVTKAIEHDVREKT